MRAHAPDYILVGIIAALLILGLITLFSASSVRAAANWGDPTGYLQHQLLYGVLPGLALGFIGYRMDYRILRRLALPIFIVGLGLIALVLSPHFGVSVKGATRWLQFGKVVVQPAELFKPGFVIFLASFFASRQGKAVSFWRVMLPFVIIMGVIGVLLMAQPATGTLGVIVITALGIYFLAGAKMGDLAVVILAALVAFGFLIAAAPYRLERLMTYLNPAGDPQGAGYQINQALIGIGSGGLVGAGIGHSRQKFQFLPETIGDSIFAIFAEETGFIGSAILATLFFFLLHRGLKTAKLSRDAFSRLLAGGIVIWISAQAFVNMAAISGLMPLTGIPLPFFSYGGSAMISLLAAMGILLNVSRYTGS